MVMGRGRLRQVLDKNREINCVRRMYWTALILRMSVGVIGYVATQYGDLPLLQDALHYEEVGYSIANDWWSGRSSDWLDTVEYGGRVAWLMAGTIGAIYYVLGVRSVFLLLAVYSAITAFVPVYIYRISQELGAPGTAAKRGAWLVVLSPAFVFWSGALYKEGLVLLILSVVTYHTLRLQSRWDLRSVLLVALATFGMLGLRFYLASLVGGAVVVALLWGRRGVTARPSAVPVVFRQVAVVLVFLAVITAFGFSQRMEWSLMETENGVLREIEVNRLDMAIRAESGYLRDAEVSTIEDAAKFMPVGLIYFLTVPHPWQFGSFRQNVIIPETMFWVALYPLIFIGFCRGFRVNPSGTLYILLVTGGLCAIYAVMSGNVGVAYRMRTQPWLLWAPFAAWGFEIWRDGRRRAKANRQGLARAVEGRNLSPGPPERRYRA